MLGLLYGPSWQIITHGRKGYAGQGEAVWTTLKVAPDGGDEAGGDSRVQQCILVKRPQAGKMRCSTARSRLQKHQECRFPSNSPLAVSLSHLSIPHGTPGTKGKDPTGRQGFLVSWLESYTGILQREDSSLLKPWGPACS